jgi:hypothetical protein
VLRQTFKLAALKAADTTASLLTALRKLEGCTDVDKAKLVETAMARKKEAKVSQVWVSVIGDWRCCGLRLGRLG